MTLKVQIVPTIQNLRLSGGRGEVAFTVTNASGKGFRGKVSVDPADSAQAGWFTIKGPAERVLSADGVEQVTIAVQAPPDASAGTYQFSIRLVSESNPDEDWVQSQSISFTVESAEKKPFPWWILIAAGAALVVIGVVLAIVLSGGKPGLGEPCAAECKAEFVCAPPGQPNAVCMSAIGGVCEGDKDCLGGSCSAGICALPGLGKACTTECAAELTCSNNICRGNIGHSCSNTEQCVTYCDPDQKKCTAGPGFGLACDPANPVCAVGLTCANQLCRKNIEAACTGDDECATGTCFQAKCSQLHTSCASTPCASTQSCENGFCRLKNSQACTDAFDCASGFCNEENKCANQPQCNLPSDCTKNPANAVCLDNKCYLKKNAMCLNGAYPCEVGTCEAARKFRCSLAACTRSSCPKNMLCSNTGRCVPNVRSSAQTTMGTSIGGATKFEKQK